MENKWQEIHQVGPCGVNPGAATLSSLSRQHALTCHQRGAGLTTPLAYVRTYRHTGEQNRIRSSRRYAEHGGGGVGLLRSVHMSRGQNLPFFRMRCVES